ncbi:MAG: tRNA (adenosine(37)-N6)-threonylcarbamoyltransferase complex ATPase subunit type 1 TsaE [Chloroflexota bacterium]
MPILDDHCLDFISRSPEQTRRIGMRLGGLLEPGDLVCLQGELGSGKTTFAQGVAQGWGALDTVSSPTFVLVNLYRRPDGGQLFHMDAYRIESAPEGEELDLESMLSQGPVLVEWPERLGNILPAARLAVNLEHVAEEHRQMRMLASGARYDAIVVDLRQAIFGVG